MIFDGVATYPGYTLDGNGNIAESKDIGILRYNIGDTLLNGSNGGWDAKSIRHKESMNLIKGYAYPVTTYYRYIGKE